MTVITTRFIPLPLLGKVYREVVYIGGDWLSSFKGKLIRRSLLSRLTLLKMPPPIYELTTPLLILPPEHPTHSLLPSFPPSLPYPHTTPLPLPLCHAKPCVHLVRLVCAVRLLCVVCVCVCVCVCCSSRSSYAYACRMLCAVRLCSSCPFCSSCLCCASVSSCLYYPLSSLPPYPFRSIRAIRVFELFKLFDPFD